MDDAEHMQRFWDERARENANYFVDNRLDYREDGDGDFWEQGARDLEVMFELLDVRPQASETILDVGCGVGRLLRALAPTASQLVGIDVSSEMLARCKENLADLSDRLTLHHGDGATLQPVADASVDGVISLVVFQHIPDPQITLGYITEMGRVLKPGGWAAFQVSNDPVVHAADYPQPSRIAQLLKRAPRGQDDPAWRGSAVTLDGLGAAAHEGKLEIERIVNEGTQYCVVLARRS